MVFPHTLCEEPSQPRPMSIMASCRSMIVAVSPVLATITLLALLVGMEGGAAWAQTGRTQPLSG